ncbi:TolC family protein [Pseudoalteromonas sp. MMG022]|uniref:TolC family protein n=1 Tax=Pseudoalteromonas sp. MMG022 TaxID=2909978 RepID=UPI001F017171|nr:TolC family protein [Pseudoalteromonas sp. MMG022]MCF6437202.1 TolC family protein [Pseudoalteromonas sp. MMG022]
MKHSYFTIVLMALALPASVQATSVGATSVGATSVGATSVGATSVGATTQQNALSLEQAITLAQQNDPWLHGNHLKQQAVEHASIAANTLPDPKVSVGMMNLPTDGWNLSQEGMTQFKVGVSQMFGRGDSLAIKSKQLKLSATQFPLQRQDRKAKLQSNVTQLWLDAYLAQKTIALIKQDRVLFEQIAEVAKAGYSSVVGKTRQQDVVRAQLELIQLEDRLTVEQQKLETALAQLNEWLHIYDATALDVAYDFDKQRTAFTVSDNLPHLELAYAALLKPEHYARNELAKLLLNHPINRAIDVKQQVSEQTIALNKQQYQPQWGVNASYGYRDDMPSGMSRADLFSVGVTFDLPLFTKNKQDKQVAAAVAESEAVKTDKLLMVKQMLSAVEKELKLLNRLSDRQTLYATQLLKQAHYQAEAALTAYTNDDGDFAEVVRARIAELNARIGALKIDVDALKAVSRINYLLTQATQPAERSHTLGAN